MLANRLLSAVAGSSEDKLFVDDVFSAYMRTGTGADATITTGIDMTKGYMLWSKGRSGSTDHAIYDSARGVTFDHASNTTAAQTTQATGLKSVSATGHTVGSLAKMNTNTATYVDFVFRKAPKFFDVVTYTGNGANRTIAHSLGQEVGMIIVKRTDTAADWQVYHRSMSNTEYLVLNSSATKATGSTRWNSTTPTTSVFSLGTDASVNASGGTYVAYLFAHDSSAEGAIQCGAFTGSGGAPVNVSLGWETQFLFVKRIDSDSAQWELYDVSRGFSLTEQRLLYPVLDSAESANTVGFPTATGFKWTAIPVGAVTYVYLAIRRSNKPPTVGTQVFNSPVRTGIGSDQVVSAGFQADMSVCRNRASGFLPIWGTRLLDQKYILSSSTAAEASGSAYIRGWDTPSALGGPRMFGSDNNSGGSGNFIDYCFKRAPGVFDVVCFDGGAGTVPHGLGVAPELTIVKIRSQADSWFVLHSESNSQGYLNYDFPLVARSDAFPNLPSASNLFLGSSIHTGSASAKLVAYLFATKAGISKVGRYTGNGSSQTINCGFTTGSRFILIRRTDAAGDWYVWDTARGIIAGNDPHLSLNTTAAEVTTNDSIDPDATGFIVNQVAATNINVNAATYIYLAFA